MNKIPLSARAEAIADIRFAPIAAIVGLGFIGHAVAGSLGAGIALLIPLILTLMGALLDRWIGPV